MKSLRKAPVGAALQHTATEEIGLEHHHRTEKGNIAFRRNLQERVSSPDQLTDYLRVTNPGIWVLLASVILLLAGVFAWASIGTLETETR